MVDQKDERRALEVKEEENPTKKAFNATAFAQILPGPAWEANRSGSFAVWGERRITATAPRVP